MMLRTLLTLTVALNASAAFADWNAGDTVPFLQCEADEVMDIARLTGPYYSIDNPNHSERSVLTCANRATGTSKTYVIESVYDKTAKTFSYRVGKVVADNDPARIFIIQNQYTHSSVRNQYDDAEGKSQTFQIGFYQDMATETCPEGAELKALPIVTKNRRPALGSPIATGVCVGAGRQRTPVGGLNILDEQELEGGAVRIVALAVQPGTDSDDNEELLVLEASPDGMVKMLARINDESYFPRGCGRYFMAARFLPGSTKLALAYRTPKLLTVDYTNLSSGPAILYDGEAGGMSTCEGYLANHESLRRELWIHQRFDMQKMAPGPKELFFLTRDTKYRPILLSFPL